MNFVELKGWDKLPIAVKVMIFFHFSESGMDKEEYWAYYLVASHTAKQYATYVFHAIMTEAFK